MAAKKTNKSIWEMTKKERARLVVQMMDAMMSLKTSTKMVDEIETRVSPDLSIPIPIDEAELWYKVMAQAVEDLGIENPSMKIRRELRESPAIPFFMEGGFEMTCAMNGLDVQAVVSILTILELLPEAPDGYTKAARETHPELASSLETISRTIDLDRRRAGIGEEGDVDEAEEELAAVC